MAPCFVYYGSGFFHSGFDLRVTVIQMVGCGDFLASSGLWWNLRCAHHVRNRSANLYDAFQSFSSHHLSASSEVSGISSYPQRRSLVGDLVQWMQILASSGMSSAPSGGQMAIFTSSPSSFDMRGTIVRSPIFHLLFESFSHAYARIMQLCPNTRTSKASPSPSLAIMAFLTGKRPCSSVSGGVALGRQVTMYEFIHDASGLCRTVLPKVAAVQTNEIAAMMSLKFRCIYSSFLRCLKGLVCAITSLSRRRKEPNRPSMNQGAVK